MFNRIEVKKIILAHVRTLRSLNQLSTNNSIYWRDLLTFLFWPAVLSYLLYILKLDLKSQISNLIAIISIFGGFLFNLLAIIYSFIEKIKTPFASDIKVRFANEINANISFCILLSVFIILLLLIFSLLPTYFYSELITYTSQFLEYTIYYNLILFFLTLLMVLSRVFTLLQKEGK